MVKNIAARSKAQMDISLEATAQVLEHLAEVGYDEKFGARPLRRAIQTHVEDNLAEGILAGTIKEGDTVNIDFIDNEVVLKAI